MCILLRNAEEGKLYPPIIKYKLKAIDKPSSNVTQSLLMVHTRKGLSDLLIYDIMVILFPIKMLSWHYFALFCCGDITSHWWYSHNKIKQIKQKRDEILSDL